MIIDLRNLDAAAGNVDSEQEVVRFENETREATVTDCAVNVSYHHNGDTYYFHGDVTTVLATSCQRCLVAIRYSLRGEFDLVVRRGGRGAEEDAAGSGEYIMLAVGESKVDFDEAIRECIVVNIPMKIVCDENCRGLCPLCGTNFNSGSCSCEQETDDRWESLRRLGTKNAED